MPTVAPIDLDDHCLAAAFLDDVPAFALASGQVVRLDHGTQRHDLHDGLLATAVSWDSRSLVSGGEDGKVMRLDADGTETVIRPEARKWISAVATGPQGAVAFADGRTATVLLSDGTERSFERHLNHVGICIREELRARIRNGKHHHDAEETAQGPRKQSRPVIRQYEELPLAAERAQQTYHYDDARQHHEIDDRYHVELALAERHEA